MLEAHTERRGLEGGLVVLVVALFAVAMAVAVAWGLASFVEAHARGGL